MDWRRRSATITRPQFDFGAPFADEGDVDAQHNLGLMYEQGHGVTQDHAVAVSWFRKAADQGFAAAQLSLGVLYENGLGVPQDFTTAVSWYRKAADQGNAAAQLNLGIMYDNGWGVAQNIAHMWFSLAAAMGDRDAARNRDIDAAKLTPAQFAEAQRLAREWEPKFTPR
jgi:TPR repeat protein